MKGYRKIEVGGSVYEWKSGKKHVHIRLKESGINWYPLREDLESVEIDCVIDGIEYPKLLGATPTVLPNRVAEYIRNKVKGD